MGENEKKISFNIALIGFMGTGKSTIAACMHTLYGMEVVEMDSLIEKREGMSIPEIFQKYGEEHFRNLETSLLIELQGKKNVVISCGGGTPLRKKNVSIMRKTGKVVLLTAKPESILERVEENHDRPLLEGNKNVSFIEEMLKKRKDRYEAAADLIVATDGRTKEEICDEIIEKVLELKR